MASETILVVEDDPTIRTLILETLRMEGYTVLAAGHPEEACQVCERHQEPIHLVIADVMLPQMHGPALVRRLRYLRPKMKVLFLSGYPFADLVHQEVLESDAAFLRKPFRLEVLRRRVRETLDAPQTPARIIYPRSDTAVDAAKVYLLLKSRSTLRKAYQALLRIWKRRNGKKNKESSSE